MIVIWGEISVVKVALRDSRKCVHARYFRADVTLPSFATPMRVTVSPDAARLARARVSRIDGTFYIFVCSR